jgi:hypothetical protein
MANRSYLYSINKKPAPGNRITVKDIQEWKYYVPISQLALLSGNPEICDSLIDKEHKAICGNYEKGVENLQALTALLSEAGIIKDANFDKEAEINASFLNNTEIKQQFFLLELFEILEMGYDDVNYYLDYVNDWAEMIEAKDIERISSYLPLDTLRWDELIIFEKDISLPKVLYFSFNNEFTLE